MFVCARPGCQQSTPVNRFESHVKGSDNSSTGGLRQHAISCWGKSKVNQVLAAKNKGGAKELVKCTRQGNLTFLFGSGSGKAFTFSF